MERSPTAGLSHQPSVAGVVGGQLKTKPVEAAEQGWMKSPPLLSSKPTLPSLTPRSALQPQVLHQAANPALHEALESAEARAIDDGTAKSSAQEFDHELQRIRESVVAAQSDQQLLHRKIKNAGLCNGRQVMS